MVVRRWLALVLVIAGLAADVSAQAAEWDLGTLMRVRAEVGASRATFEERREIGLLSDPVHLRGRLVYRAPDYFRKTVTEPEQEELVVEGDRITITRDGRRDTLTLGDDPLLTGLVEAMRGTLAGDRDALERHYQVGFTGARERWSLRLRPRNAPLRERLERIVIRGSGAAIASIELLQANGDRSIMRIAHSQ